MMPLDPPFADRPAPAASTRRVKLVEVRSELPTFRRSLAAVIGVNEYGGDIPRLRTAALDATALARRLLLDHGYDVLLLTDDAPAQALAASLADDVRVRVQPSLRGATLLPDRRQLFLLGQATRDALTDLLQLQLPSLLTPDDRLLIYFAGHGITLNHQGDDGPEGFLLPVDAEVAADVRDTERSKFLPMVDFFGDLARLPCRHLLAVLDCCFAGAGRFFSTGDPRTPPPRLYREHYEQFVRSPARQAIGSAAYNQEALDIGAGFKLGTREAKEQVDDRPERHSPFALALFDALDGEADGFQLAAGQRDSALADGVITATELFYHLQYRVTHKARDQASHVQDPELMTLRRHEAGEYLFVSPGRPLNLPAAPPTYSADPWRGEQPYAEADTSLFYGRDEAIQELLTRIAEQPVTVVMGPSSSGKTSLLRAGVTARLQEAGGRHQGSGDEGSAAEGARWEVVGVWEAGPPLTALAEALARHPVLSQLQPPDEAQLRADPAALAGLVQRWAQAHPQARLLLVFDALDRALAGGDEASNRQLSALLEQALALPAGCFRLLAAIRSAHEPELIKWSPLAAHWEAARFDLAFAEDAERKPIPRLQDANLRAAIDGPASERILIFQPHELLNTVVSHVGDAPGVLACLSLTMSALYRQFKDSCRDDRSLTLADYEKLRAYVYEKVTEGQPGRNELAANGVSGVLCARATELYWELEKEPHAAEAMRRLFLRLVAAEGSEIPWRRLPEAELVYADDAETRQVQGVKDRLLDARLLVQACDPTLGVYLEPVHPALMRDWRLLQEWKREADSYLPVQRELAGTARKWDAEGRPSGLLWDDDPRLPQVEKTLWPTATERKGLARRAKWVKQLLTLKRDAPSSTEWLTSLEFRFVLESLSRRASRFRTTVLVTTAVIFVLSVLMIFAGVQWRNAVIAEDTAETRRIEAVKAKETSEARRLEAEKNAAIARARELSAQSAALADTNAVVSTLLAVEAVTATHHLDPAIGEVRVAAAEQRLLDVLLRPTGRLPGGDGARLAAPDGRLLLVAVKPSNRSDTGRAAFYLWTIQGDDVRSSFLFERTNGSTGEFRFSPDGRWLVEADEGIGLWLHDAHAPDGKSSRLLPKEDLQGKSFQFQFSPDGRWLVANVRGHFRLWDTHQAAIPAFEFEHKEEIYEPIFSADGHWLVTNSSVEGPENTTSLWDLSGSMPTRWILATGEKNRAIEVVFSTEYGYLVILSKDGILSLWNTARPDAAPAILADMKHQWWTFDPSPDGQSFAARAWGGGHFVYLLKFNYAGANVTELELPTDSSRGAYYNPDGAWLLTAGGGNSPYSTVTFSKILESGISSRVLADQLETWALFPDNRRLLITRKNGDTRVWDLANPQLDSRLLYKDAVRPLGFSPDKRWLVTSAESAVLLWDTADLDADPIVLAGHEGQATRATFSGDSRWLVTSGADGARLWDMEHLTAVPNHTLRYHTGGVKDLAFSPGGKWLASGSADVTARLTNLEADFGQLPKTGYEGEVSAAAFSPDGKWFATGSQDGFVRIYSMAELLADEKQKLKSGGEVTSLAFSPDSRWLAAAHVIGEIWMWDIQDLHKEPRLLAGTGGWIHFLSFSPDGRWLASSGQGAVAQVWDMQASPPKLWYLSNSLTHVSAKAGAISPTGAWLATVTERTNFVPLWDYRNRDANPIILHSDKPLRDDTIAFSHDGRWLAAVDQANAIRVWDTTDVGAAPLVLRGIYSQTLSLAFDPMQRWLASGHDDGAIRLWDLDMARLQSQACRNVGRNLSWEEWAQYFPAEPVYRATCPEYPVHPSVVQHELDEGDIAWQAGDETAAMARYRQAATWDPSVDPVRKASDARLRMSPELISGELISGGMGRAMRGDLERAFSEFDQALRLEPKTPVEELRAQARTHAFRWLVSMAVLLLKNDQIQQALEKLTEAVRLSALFDTNRIEEIRSKGPYGRVGVDEEEKLLLGLASKGDPEFVAHKFAAAYLLQLGCKVSNWPKKPDDTFDRQYAITKFELAKSLDSSVKLDPTSEAWRCLIGYWLEYTSPTNSSLYEYAARKVQKAVEVADLNLDLPASSWNKVCWFGSLYGFAARVVNGACEKAVALADPKQSPGIRDSRGLARALTGDIPGAISDFQAFASQRSGPEANQRANWIKRLSAGEPPSAIFTFEILICLISSNCAPDEAQ